MVTGGWKETKGVWLCIKGVAPYMKRQGKGKIINVSSNAWMMGVPFLLHYTTTKAAVAGLTKCIAKELGEFGINVNTLAPGFTMTEASATMAGAPPGLAGILAQQTALKKVEAPEDLAGTVIFLASEDSDFLAGQMINVDGGFIMY